MAPSDDEGAGAPSDTEAAQDDREYANALNAMAEGGEALNRLIGDINRDFDQSGKADDAVDFEDFSDDDELPDEEPGPEEDEEVGGQNSGDVPALTDDGGTSNDTDDLFGDGPSSPTGEDGLGGIPSSPARGNADDDRYLNFDREDDIFSGMNQDPTIPSAPDNLIDFVKQQWPGFEENKVLEFQKLLEPKPGKWQKEKRPNKPPKPLQLNKLSLEVEVDQEKAFRLHGPANVPIWQKHAEAASKGLICCEEFEPMPQTEIEAFDMDEDDDEEVDGLRMRDFEIVCEDWESTINIADVSRGEPQHAAAEAEKTDEEDDWDAMFLDEPAQGAKKAKPPPPKGLPAIARYDAPNFDNFQQATAKLGKRVFLDMSDPYLLLQDASAEPVAKRPKLANKLVKMVNGKTQREVRSRFDFSNDEPYEALKENAAGKVRVNISNLSVEHTLPARKLIWPYYSVKLSAADPHSYHRPTFQTRAHAHTAIRFSRPTIKSRKALKLMRSDEIYKESKDLTLGDNSTAVLFEYSEEIPTVLSNFGMGNRVINYHREEGREGEQGPPKNAIGENHILLREDKSPFTIFGPIKPGETVPTLHNKMFHAPIFKHNPRQTDFLISRSHTGLSGSQWYLRNIDHMFVVGQNLPIAEIPGPHARKVTTTIKNRMKMVAYRMIRKHGALSLPAITRHVAGSSDSQNRQKLKEFLDFRKETKDWGLRPGEQLMDEEAIMELVQPEDVCLMDAMQVGAHELESGGYSVKESEKDEGNDTVAGRMAPWNTTKAFLEASAGRAMVAVHGPGDPTGHGLGVSFIRISMKGGFVEAQRGPQATSNAAMEREKKNWGGHQYNVKDQDKKYTDALAEVWNAQKATLQDAEQHEDDDVQPREDEDDRFNTQRESVVATPGARGDSFSVASRPSATSGQPKRRLRIMREVREDGVIKHVPEIVNDPVVIQQYVKRRQQMDQATVNIYDKNLDVSTLTEAQKELYYKEAAIELDRLTKNKERRNKREQLKALDKKRKRRGGGGPGDADGDEEDGAVDPSPEKGGTTRKCANCGQVGHIKTNKKLCPMLNGTIAPTSAPPGLNGSSGPINAPVAAEFS